jgi:hypothetical protein
VTGTKGVIGRHAVTAHLTLPRWIYSWLVAAVLVLATLGVGPAAAVPPATTTPAAASAQWLLSELGQGSGLIPGVAPGIPDVGVSSDTLLGLAAAGRTGDAEFAVTTRAIATHLTGYAAFPSGHVTALLAGPFAKTLLVAQVGGADPSAFGGWNLPATLRSMLTTTGPNAGRFSDRFTGADSSNGFSQVFAVLGLIRTSAGVPASAVDFLLRQQCSSGGFRLFYDTPGHCQSNVEEDSDATALSVQALTALSAANPADSRLSSARTRAANWLAALQDSNGGVSGTGPTKGDNANTTALAAVAFRECGLAAAALSAEQYVSALQLRTGPDAGAVAYNASTLALAGPAGNIPATSRDQWRRTASQAILAFGLPGYNALQGRTGAPIPPPSTPPVSTPPPSTPPPSTPPPSTPPVATPTKNAGTPAPSVPAGMAPTLTNDTNSDRNEFAVGSDSYDLGNTADEGDSGNNGAAPEADPSPSTGADQQANALPQAAASPAPTLTNTHPAAAQAYDNSTPQGVWWVLAIGGGIGAGALVLRLQPTRRKSP